MRNTGNPLSAEVCKTFTEVGPPTRLAYLSLIDFVPDHEPYEHLTTIYIEPGRAAADPHRQGGRGRRPVRARARCPGHPTRPRS